MTTAIRFIFAAVIIAWVVAGPVSAAEPAPSGDFLAISDLHFNPMDDLSLLDQLATAEPALWPAILDSARNPTLSPYGRDTNWPLLRSTLDATQRTLPNPAFIILPGDLLAHGYRKSFDAATDHSAPAFRDFVRKTLEVLAVELRKRFPEAPVLLTLGNNDEICGDYELQPNGPFLADTLPIMHKLLSTAADDAFDQEWLARSDYVVRLGAAHLRVIFADTVYLSRKYRNVCGHDGDPGEAMLKWLEQQLAAAERAQEKVWLLYHIPPGIDAYSTLERGACPGRVVLFWKDTYQETFLALMHRYATTITASFAGHTHMDEFRLIPDAGAVFGIAAVSPIFGQNPSFATFSYRENGQLLDRTTYYLDLSAQQPEWQREYRFDEAWNLSQLDVRSLKSLYATINTLPEAQAKWLRFYRVSRPTPQLSNQQARAYTCAIDNLSAEPYTRCRCQPTSSPSEP